MLKAVGKNLQRRLNRLVEIPIQISYFETTQLCLLIIVNHDKLCHITARLIEFEKVCYWF